MLSLNIHLGNPNFISSQKKFIDITDYIDNKTIEIEETTNNVLPVISSADFSIQLNKDLKKDNPELYEFLTIHKDLSLFPIVITLGSKTIFNGLIKMYTKKVQNNYKYTNEKSIIFNFSNIIHKAEELKYRYLSNVISSKEVNIDKYFNYLFQKNNRITKYINYEEYLNPIQDVAWGSEEDLVWHEEYESIYWGFDVSDVQIARVGIDKSKLYNTNTLTVGDSIHIFNTVSGSVLRNSYVIKQVKNFYEKSDIPYLDYIELKGAEILTSDIKIILDLDNTINLYYNGIKIASGKLSLKSLKANLSGTYNGKIKVTQAYMDMIDLVQIQYLWGKENPYYWGQDSQDFDWGGSIEVNLSKVEVKTFNPIAIYPNTLKTRAIMGWVVESLDDTGKTLVSNSIVQSESAMSLVDTLSNDYLFNYAVTNDGVINLYTSSSEVTENEDYVLKIGNNPYNLILDSALLGTNCKLYDEYEDEVTDLETLEDCKILPTNPSLVYEYKFTLTNLEEGKQYILSIDTNADSINVTHNNTTPIDLVELYYYRTPKFKFTAPTGITSLEIILGGNIGTPSITINELFIKDFYYTDAEYDAIYAPIEVQSDSSGLRTALHVQNYKQTKQDEAIEQILSIAPAQNTYHRIVEDEITNPSETLSTGTGDTQYITLGRGISTLTFPILTDKDTYICNINLNLFRTTFGTNDCILVSFVRNTTERIFAQIIPQSQIGTSLQIQPAFLHKKYLDKLECILYAKRRDSSRTITNSKFTTTNADWYVPTEKVFIINGGSLVELKILSVVGNLITLEGSYNLTSDVMANKNNTATGTYLELECTTIFDDTDDYLIISDTLNSSLALVRETTIQNAYVCRLPISNIGASYNGTPEQVYIKYNNAISATFSIVDKSGASSTFVNSQPEFFDKILDYDLVYLRLFNTSKNKYEVVRLKSYDTTNNTITLWDEVNLSNFAYELGSAKIVEFARIFITTTGSFEAKATDDTIYEAYITSDRYSFGFNNKVDVQAIDYLLKKNTTKKFGRIYDIGNILTAVYDISLSFPRYLENVDAIEQYGTILEEPMADEITDLNTFIITTDNSLKYNASPTTSTKVTAHLDFLADLKPNEDIYKAKLVRLYNEVLESGLYSIENKRFIFNKNNINLCELTLEKLV